MHYNVAPRYTPGSPSLVDGKTAERVAKEETRFIEHALSGAWGEKQKERARLLGLRGIAEQRVERGTGRKRGWEIHDLCTGERFFRLCHEALRALGWRMYNDLATYEQAEVDKNPPTDIEGFREKGWFKVEPAMTSGFPAGWTITVYRPEKLDRA